MTTSNFKFLEKQRPELYRLGLDSEEYIYSDPQSAVVKLRCFAELFVGSIYNELHIKSNINSNLHDKINYPPFQQAVEIIVIEKLHLIRMKGNRAAHQKKVSAEDAVRLLKEAFFLGAWIHVAMDKGRIEDLPTYCEPLAPQSIDCTEQGNNGKSQLEIEELQDELALVKSELACMQNALKESQVKTNAESMEIDIDKMEEVRTARGNLIKHVDFEQAETRRRIQIEDAFAEYTLTQEQDQLVKQLDVFLNSSEHNTFLLKGYAGAGKTFITKGLTEYFRAIGRNYVLAAPTGKAAKVIAKKTSSPAYTIHKTIYSLDDIKEYSETNLDGSKTYKFYAELGVNGHSADTVYIIDEASMVSDIYQEDEFFRFGTGFLLKDFLKYVNIDHNEHSKKVIFIGDNAQLPPVGMNFSPALKKSYLANNFNLKITSFELTEVVRQKAESGVLENAKKLRQALKESNFNRLVFNASFPDIKEVIYTEFMHNYLASCGDAINGESIVVCHSNHDVAEFNKSIREHFFPDQVDIVPGDKVMATNNSDKFGFFISNGDFGLVKQVLSPTEIRHVTLKSRNRETKKVEEILIILRFKDVELAFRDEDGKVHKIQTKIVENLLDSDEPGLSSDEKKAIYVDFCTRHPNLRSGTMEFKNTLLSDPYFNSLKVKYGYAITCHKAQGSEWNHVFVKCSTHMNQRCESYFRWIYTAITRTAKNLYLMDKPHITPGGVNIVGVNIHHSHTPQGITTEQVITPEPVQQETPKVPAAPVATATENENHGIPPENSFLLAVLAEVRNAISGTEISIDHIDHHSYQEAYFFKRVNEIARINLIYNGRSTIARIHAPQTTELASVVVERLRILEGKVFRKDGNQSQSQGNGQNPNTALHVSPAPIVIHEPFLNYFHETLKKFCSENNIEIRNLHAGQFFQRYTFGRGNSNVIFNIYYNKKKRFASFAPQGNSADANLRQEVADLIRKATLE